MIVTTVFPFLLAVYVFAPPLLFAFVYAFLLLLVVVSVFSLLLGICVAFFPLLLVVCVFFHLLLASFVVLVALSHAVASVVPSIVFVVLSAFLRTQFGVSVVFEHFLVLVAGTSPRFFVVFQSQPNDLVLEPPYVFLVAAFHLDVFFSPPLVYQLMRSIFEPMMYLGEIPPVRMKNALLVRVM